MTTTDHREGNYQMSKAGLFVLVGSQRCGTNFFREVLGTHGQVAVHGEVMWPYPHTNVWHNYLRYMVSRAMPPVLDGDAMGLIDDYFVYLADDTRRNYPDKASKLAMIGVDIKYNQLRFVQPLIQDLMAPPFMLTYLRQRRVRVVHMMRRNIAHQALSLVIANQRNVFHNYKGKAFEGKQTIEPKLFTNWCYWIRDQRELFRQLSRGISLLEVWYEDLAAACDRAGAGKPLAKDAKVVTEISAFLEIPPDLAAPATISKVINRPFREIITNHGELVAALEKTDFREFAGTL